MGGMLAATFLAIFFVPMFFKLITDRHLTERRSTAEIRDEIAHHEAQQERAAEVPHHVPPPEAVQP
jgi:multidrug efflux pump